MKKLSKEQIEKRNKLKQYLLKSLHIISYILSALFIIVCISVGVQSCNNKNKNKVNKNFDSVQNVASLPVNRYPYYYTSIFGGGYNEISLQKQNDILTSSTSYDVYTSYPSLVGNEQNVTISLTSLYVYVLADDEFIPMNQCIFVFKCYSDGTNSCFRLKQITLQTYNSYWFNFCTKRSESGSNVLSDNYYSFSIQNDVYDELYATEEIENNLLLDNFFVVNQPSDFVMSYNLNYYWWASNNQKQVFDDVVDIVKNSIFDNNSHYVKSINIGPFVSNGKLYDTINLYYYALSTNVNNLYWSVNGKPSNVYPQSGYGYFTGMTYVNSQIDYSPDDVDIVYSRQVITLTDTNGHPHEYYTNDCSWSNESWRSLTLLKDLDETSGDYISLISLNDINRVSVYTGGIFDVFTLFKQTFSAIMPVLNIAVLPNFTIAMLLTIPLAVTTIIVIVRLVKK